LKKIEEEVRSGGGGAPVSGIPAPRPTVLSDNTTASGSLPQHLVYLERLKKLREKGGLSDHADQENVENYSGGIPAPHTTGYSSGLGSGYLQTRGTGGLTNQRYVAPESTDNNQEENQNTNQNTAAPNVDDIRKRLAKIKSQAF